ncbi:hypothetical protein V6N13_015627 [Hibiscus sabdariffa]
MRSHSSSLLLHHFSSPTGFPRSPKRRASVPVSSPRLRVSAASSFYFPIRFQLKRSRNAQKRRRRSGCDVVKVKAADDDPFDDWAIDDTMAGYIVSSDGEYSDGDLALNSLSDEDLPLEEALAKASRRIALRGYVGVPLLRIFKFHEVVRKIGPPKYMRKKRTPTMGGLFFVPVGIAVARFTTGVYSVEVAATAAATFAFAAIGLLDDALSFTKRKSGMDPWLRLLLEAAVGIWFSFWLDTTNLSSPYGMYIFLLTILNHNYLGVNLADGLDGLVAGTAALAFIAMSIVVLPICPELSIFGAAMAGACIGFLLHNQYKAAVIMGDTGSSALGGALAAMAACTGMFFPLFIASGFFVLEVSSVIMQVLYFKYTKQYEGSGRRLFKMVPLHLHLELCGHKEPMIVACAYAISCVLALFAAYIGLISA